MISVASLASSFSISDEKRWDGNTLEDVSLSKNGYITYMFLFDAFSFFRSSIT